MKLAAANTRKKNLDGKCASAESRRCVAPMSTACVMCADEVTELRARKARNQATIDDIEAKTEEMSNATAAEV